MMSQSPDATVPDPFILIHHEGCPRVDEARVLLRTLLTELGQPAVWQEWNQRDPLCPVALRRLPSPTIRISGQAAADSDPDVAAACRLGPLPCRDELKAAFLAARSNCDCI
jgi:hypothetical protein